MATLLIDTLLFHHLLKIATLLIRPISDHITGFQLDCEQSLFSSKNLWGRSKHARLNVGITCELQPAMPLVAQALETKEKKAAAMVSNNILDTRHSGDRVILLVGLR